MLPHSLPLPPAVHLHLSRHHALTCPPPAHPTLQLAQLTETVDGLTDATILAPTNDAFDNLLMTWGATLQEFPKIMLSRVLLYHLLTEPLMASDLPASGNVTTFLGEDAAPLQARRAQRAVEKQGGGAAGGEEVVGPCPGSLRQVPCSALASLMAEPAPPKPLL